MLGSYLARLSLTAAGSLRRPKGGVRDALAFPFRPWPTDIDVYGHVNNGRYLTLMDFGRLDFTIRTGMLKEMASRRWIPVLGGAAVKFRRELRPFDDCELVTRLLDWDEKWFFFEHRMVANGDTCAVGVVKGVMKKGKRTVALGELFEVLGETGDFEPEVSDELRKMIDAI